MSSLSEEFPGMSYTEEQINVKICEFLELPCHKIIYESFAQLPGFNKINRIDYIGPDFCNDLNAMYDAWKHICKIGETLEDQLYFEGLRDDYADYLDNLATVLVKKNGGSYTYTLANLSARQKAVCFLSMIDRQRKN